MNLDDMFGDDMDGVENRIDCERMMERMTFRESSVFHKWLRGDTQEEIAQDIGVSERTIRRIMSKIWKKRPL